MKKPDQGFSTAAQDSNPGSLSRQSLPLNHCALREVVCIVHVYCRQLRLNNASTYDVNASIVNIQLLPLSALQPSKLCRCVPVYHRKLSLA